MQLNTDSYGKILSFSVYPTTILGDIFQRVKLMSILDFDTANLLPYTDIPAMSVKVYPHLPAGTPKDYKKYHWAKFQHVDGSFSIIALEWINLNTIKEHTKVEIRAVIEAESIDASLRLRSCLESNNFIIKDITTI